MADTTVNGITVMQADMLRPFGGRWTARIEFDGGLSEGDAAALRLLGVDYSGTVREAGVIGARGYAMIVGGSGGYDRSLPSKHYSYSPTVAAVVNDIMTECGETLSPTTDSNLLAQSLTAWTRTAGTAGDMLAELAEYIGASCRVLADGTTWVGAETWPAVYADWILIGGSPDAGRITIAAEVAGYGPGDSLDGMRLASVKHIVTPQQSRSVLRLMR